MISQTLSGDSELLDKMQELSTSTAIASAAIGAGVKVIRNAGVQLSPGRVKLEWGSMRMKRGDKIIGIVGLGVGGYRAKVKRAHGVYLNNGTPYVIARSFVQQAFQTSRSRALAAMKRASQKRLQKMTGG